MTTHRTVCIHNHVTTEEVFELEEVIVIDVFGYVYARWFLIKWKDTPRSQIRSGNARN